MSWLNRLWPQSLAGRLTLFLVIALALAQAVLTALLSSQRDGLFEGALHSQSLNQTVVLTRLLNDYPPADAPQLIAAFGSRETCATVGSVAPATHMMTASEQQLSQALGGMLHDTEAGTPLVTIETEDHPQRSCADADTAPAPATANTDDHRRGPPPDRNVLDTPPRFASLAMDVPLKDGRWLNVTTHIGYPGDLDRVTIVSFLLSAGAAALVVFLVVRGQTRSLRSLAAASERFGRGEAVPPLPTSGPIEVSAATRAFNTMQDRLTEFLRDRLRLLGGISHDLRTPITTLRLKAEFIEDDEVREDLVKTIDELTTIVEATLAFTTAEATSEEPQMVELGELVREVEQEFILAGKPVEAGEMAAVRRSCRPVALRRVLRNLVDNAIRYGERAAVSVLDAGDDAIIRVEDRGPGIPADRMEEALKPFVRLEGSRSTETGGIGLGLSIARSIVAAHGGSLTLSNLPDRGLRAEIRLPLAGHQRG